MYSGIPILIKLVFTVIIYLNNIYSCYGLYVEIYSTTNVLPTIYIIDVTVRTVLTTCIATSMAISSRISINKFIEPIKDLTEDIEAKRKWKIMSLLYVFLFLTVAAYNCFMKVFIYGWKYYKYDWMQDIQFVLFSFTLYSYVQILVGISNRLAVLSCSLNNVSDMLKKDIVKRTHCIAMRYNTLCKSIEQINRHFGAILITSFAYLILSKLYCIILIVNFAINRTIIESQYSYFIEAFMVFVGLFAVIVVIKHTFLLSCYNCISDFLGGYVVLGSRWE